MVWKAVRIVLMGILALVALIESVGWAAVIAEDSGSGDRTGLVLAVSMLGLVRARPCTWWFTSSAIC